MKINREQIEKHGLKLEEYNKIKELLEYYEETHPLKLLLQLIQ